MRPFAGHFCAGLAFADAGGIRQSHRKGIHEFVEIRVPFVARGLLFFKKRHRAFHGLLAVLCIGETDLSALFPATGFAILGEERKAVRLFGEIHAGQNGRKNAVSGALRDIIEVEVHVPADGTLEHQPVAQPPERVIILEDLPVTFRIGNIKVIPGCSGKVETALQKRRRKGSASWGNRNRGELGNIFPDFSRREPADAEIFEVLVNAIEHRHFRIARDGHSGQGHVLCGCGCFLNDKGLGGFLSLPVR